MLVDIFTEWCLSNDMHDFMLEPNAKGFLPVVCLHFLMFIFIIKLVVECFPHGEVYSVIAQSEGVGQLFICW